MLAAFHSLWSRAGVRAAGSNFGWLIAEKMLRLVLGVMVGLWLARHLGPERFGTLSYCVAVAVLIGFLPEMGLEAVMKRELLRRPDSAAELLASSWVLRLGAGALVAVGLCLLVWSGWGFTPEEARVLAVLSVLAFQPACWVADLWLQAHLLAKWSVLAQLGALTFAAAARVALILLDAPLAGFAAVIVGEMLVAAAFLAIAAHRAGLRWQAVAARTQTMRRLVSAAWPLMFANLAVLIYMRIAEVMLRHLAGAEEVGFYGAAVKLSEVWYFVPTALASSVLPAMLRSREADPALYARRQQHYCDLSAGIAYAVSLPVALFSPGIVRLAYGAEFSSAAPILAVHTWASVFVFLGVARGQWLVTEGLQKFYLVATVAGAVVNVVLNFILIPRWGGLGAAWATVVSYACASWLASWLHPAVRPLAWVQTRALLIPFRAWEYFRARS